MDEKRDIIQMLAVAARELVALRHAEEALAVDKARSATVVSECMRAMDREIAELQVATAERDALAAEIEVSTREIRTKHEELHARAPWLSYEADADRHLRDLLGLIRGHFVKLEAARRRINQVTDKYDRILAAQRRTSNHKTLTIRARAGPDPHNSFAQPRPHHPQELRPTLAINSPGNTQAWSPGRSRNPLLRFAGLGRRIFNSKIFRYSSAVSPGATPRHMPDSQKSSKDRSALARCGGRAVLREQQR
jgi:hypothetical protein